ncbi:MAG: ATP-binding cassette domain-containing protein [Oscillospiraceae bacterium]|nr:ATP-binding cassette domain-containing protein [Oscillospiraceae bacterium]
MKMTAQGLTKEYARKSGNANRFTALHPLDFTLETGALTVLMGRSGSGKSTLLNLLAGLMRPTGGTVLAGETDLFALSDRELSAFRNAHIGVIPQGQTAIYSLSVLENVLLPYTLTGSAEGEEIARAKALLERLDIAGLADISPADLSGGELRRMAIARALVRQPEILLADEPTADLDDENTATVCKALQAAAGAGAAVLMVTHESGAEAYADRMLTMQGGVLSE